MTDAIPSDARRVSVAPERLARWVQGFAARHGSLFWSVGDEWVEVSGEDGSRAWFEVPFPPLPPTGKDSGNDCGYDTGDVAAALVEHAARSRRVGAILVRRGGYAAGVFQGSDLVSSKVGSSYVQGTTKAGGWSQQRFARRRDNQARAAFAAAADTALRIVLPQIGALDAVVTGGDRLGIEAVLADPRLARLRALVSGPLLDVPDPRLRVLQQLPEQFRAVRIRIHP